MTDPLTDAVKRLKRLQQDVERLKAGQDEEGEPRLFVTAQEVAAARDSIEIAAEDVLAVETALAVDSIEIAAEDVLAVETALAADAIRFEGETVRAGHYNRVDAGYDTLTYR